MAEPLTMTDKQRETLGWLRRKLMFHHGGGRLGHTCQYEYKCWELRQVGRKLSLVAEIGRVNDEGTAAALFARDRRHIWIGPRGGLELANAKNKRRARGKHVVYELTTY